MRDFLSKANWGGIGISVFLSVIGYVILNGMLDEHKKPLLGLGIAICCTGYRYAIERVALRRLGGTEIQLRGNPLLGRVLGQFAFLIAVGAFLFSRLPLSSKLDFLVFSLLIYFLVSSMFETHRLLRRRKVADHVTDSAG